MYYIRTEKNNYNIDIVIDVTDNEHFVQTSGLSWIETDVDISPQIGDYYYNNKFINLQSEDYKIIENIIFEYEEIKRIEREAEEERIRLEIERQMHENPIEPAPPELTIDAPLIDPRTLPKPVPGPLIGIEITMQNYEHWSNANANTNVLINALETKNPVVEDRIAKFDPPIEFPDGVIQSEFAFPDDSLGEYIDYLKQTDFYQKELLTRMKAYLGIV
jgi:hypothetical protein